MKINLNRKSLENLGYTPEEIENIILSNAKESQFTYEIENLLEETQCEYTVKQLNIRYNQLKREEESSCGNL